MYDILNQIFTSIYTSFNLGNTMAQKSYLPGHAIKTAYHIDSKEISKFVTFSHSCAGE